MVLIYATIDRQLNVGTETETEDDLWNEKWMKAICANDKTTVMRVQMTHVVQPFLTNMLKLSKLQQYLKIIVKRNHQCRIKYDTSIQHFSHICQNLLFSLQKNWILWEGIYVKGKNILWFELFGYLKNMYFKKSRSDPFLSYLLTPTEIYRKIDNIN